MFLVGFPLLIVALAFYNMIVFLTPGVQWTDQVKTFHLMSGVDWTVTFGDILIAVALLLLFIEIIKATGAKSIVDHILSLLVFAGAVAEFLLVPQAATSTFALLIVICFIDLIGGVSIRMRVSRLDRPAETSREHPVEKLES